MLITSNAHLRQYVRVSKDLDIEDFTPYEQIAQNKYFAWMSQSLIAFVYSYSAAALGTPQRTSYEFFMGALARMSLLEYTSTGEIRIGAEGITRYEHTTAKSAYKGQMNSLKEQLEETAYMEINNLVELFNENPLIFTDWATSPGSLINSGLLIKSAKEFNEVQKLHRGFSTFMMLVPDMEIQQEFYLSSAIEETILNDFIENTSSVAIRVKARKLAVKALVQFTIARGIETGLVKLSSSGVQVIEEDYNTSNKLVKQAPTVNISASIRKFEDTGERFINKCVELLRSNTTEFPTQPSAPTSTKPTNLFRV